MRELDADIREWVESAFYGMSDAHDGDNVYLPALASLAPKEVWKVVAKVASERDVKAFDPEA